MEFFFPSLKTPEADPGQTLQAPFAEQKEGPPAPVMPGQAPEQAKAQPLPENATPLNKPHRSSSQVAVWVAPIAAQLLTFDDEDYQNDLKDSEGLFDAGGRKQYLEFLKTSSIEKVLKLNKYYVRSYAKDSPLLLNEGEAGGRYHWLFDVPVMVSYMDRSMKDYKSSDPINQLLVIKVQVGRSANAKDPSGMVIEHWSGKSVKLDK